MNRKIIIWRSLLIFLILIVSSVLISTHDSEGKTHIDQNDNEIIIWDVNTYGDIYSYFYDSYVEKKEKVGFADGNGTIAIDYFDLLSNQSLIIKPGVRIITTNNIDIYGNIEAVGTENIKIIIQSEGDNALRVHQPIVSPNRFEHCIIDNLDLISKSSISIEHCSLVNISKVELSQLNGNDESSNIQNNRFFNVSRLEINTSRVVVRKNSFEKMIHCAITPKDEMEIVDNFFSNISWRIDIVCSSENIKIFEGNNITNSYCDLYSGLIAEHNLFKGSVAVGKEVKFQNNTIIGEVIISIAQPPAIFRNNQIQGKMDYYDMWLHEGNDSIPDLRFNQWGRDWNVEEVIGIYDEVTIERTIETISVNEFEYYNISIKFEPYFDENWTLTDNDGMTNLWEIQNELDIYKDDSLMDPDDDGLININEYICGSDPHNNDTDKDGMPDGWEFDNDLMVLCPDGDIDNEQHGNPLIVGDPLFGEGHVPIYNVEPLYWHQGFNNSMEYLAGTDPNNRDSDGDGIGDGWEYYFNLDPLVNDSDLDYDSDGFSNYEELFLESSKYPYDPLDPKSHPSADGDESILKEKGVQLVLGLFFSLLIPLIIIAIILKLVKKKKAHKLI